MDIAGAQNLGNGFKGRHSSKQHWSEHSADGTGCGPSVRSFLFTCWLISFMPGNAMQELQVVFMH